MRTLGIDLASQAPKTAACAIDWRDGRGTVAILRVGLDDDQLLAMARESKVVGIDAPFGWPTSFVAMMARHHSPSHPTALAIPPWFPELRDSLRFRRTDYVVRESLGRWPLSVSSDLIAIVAMRCAGLLDRLEVRDRGGAGPVSRDHPLPHQVVEVYPAVALSAWGLAHRRYKGSDATSRAVLGGLVKSVRDLCPNLSLSRESADLCSASDHAFAALVGALVARAAFLGLTTPPPEADATIARDEGWIAIPHRGSLRLLVT